MTGMLATPQLRALLSNLDPGPDASILDLSREAMPLDTLLPRRPARATRLDLPDEPLDAAAPFRGTRLESFPDQHFDLILACPLGICPANPRSLVATLKRVLRSGGRLLIEVPVDPSEASTDNPRAGWPHRKENWRHAFEYERLWVDTCTVGTRTAAGGEYTQQWPARPPLPGHPAPDSNGSADRRSEKVRAIPACDWYLTLSGLK